MSQDQRFAIVNTRLRRCTGDAARETGDALAVRDGRIIALGNRDDVLAALGADAPQIDARGATLLPGLVDTHPHLLHFAARAGQYVDISDARDHADIVARIRARAATTPKGQWIVTTPVGEPFYFIRRSWRDLAERCLPDRHVLDRATPDHPVFIAAYGPVTPNVCAFNSAGLKKIGLTSYIPDLVCHVEIEKDEAGALTGRLRGAVNNYYTFDPFWTQILRQLPGMDGVDVAATTRRAMAQYNAMGVTTAYEGHNMTAAQIGVYKALRAANQMTVRVLAALEMEITAFPPFEPLTDADFRANLDLARSMVSRDDDLLRIDGATLATGGPCWPGFLRTHSPYKDPWGTPTRGVTFISLERQNAFLRYCAEHGLRANLLAGGDRDHDDFLEACERLAETLPVRDRRWIVQHCILTTRRHIERYKALGFDMTTSMSFSWGKGDLYAERIGEHALRDLVPLQRYLDLGMPVACGTDWGPKNIFEHIRFAQTHEFAGSGRRNATPDHAVSREAAILMWTRDAARVLQWPEVGTLAVGNQADLTLLDRDPFTCTIDDLPTTKVLRTWLGGRLVHDAA
jgi:hypothetical protein